MRPRSGSRVAAAGLVVGNLVPLVGVLTFEWSVASLLLVYWLESGVIGASFYAKVRRASGEDDPSELPSMTFNDRSLGSFVGLAGYHAVSFWRNVVVGGETSRRGPVALMVEPYRRVLVLHLTVIFGMFGVMALGAPVALVAVMVLAKTALDFRGHWREHRVEPVDEASSEGSVTT